MERKHELATGVNRQAAGESGVAAEARALAGLLQRAEFGGFLGCLDTPGWRMVKRPEGRAPMKLRQSQSKIDGPAFSGRLSGLL